MPEIYDISPPLTGQTRVYPGDTPLRYSMLSDIENGGAHVSEICCTAHLGAHADAPAHYLSSGACIGGISPEIFIGPCRLIKPDLSGSRCITADHLSGLVDVPRILICTAPCQDFNRFDTDYVYLGTEAAELLASGVCLVGIDSPSVDKFNSHEAPAHKALLSAGVIILENLYLNEVPDGLYELIALPLKLVHAEASPVRAVLRRL